MKAWLKGGIVGGFIGVVIGGYILLLSFKACWEERGGICNLYMSLSQFIGTDDFWPNFYASLIFYIVIGVLIGWIYGKMRAKKQQPVQTK